MCFLYANMVKCLYYVGKHAQKYVFVEPNRRGARRDFLMLEKEITSFILLPKSKRRQKIADIIASRAP